MEPDYFSLNIWNITHLDPAATLHCPKTMSNLSKFPCRPWSRVGKIWKCKISTFIWISDRSSIIVYKDVKYHRRPCSGQPLKFAVSNSAPVAHFSKRSKDPPGHIGHTQTNIAEFDPMPTKFWFMMAQSNREVAIITVGERTVALKSIARCSITQTPTGQSKVWWWHAR